MPRQRRRRLPQFGHRRRFCVRWCGSPTATTRASRAIVLVVIYHNPFKKS